MWSSLDPGTRIADFTIADVVTDTDVVVSDTVFTDCVTDLHLICGHHF
jgi:hypothetical protein